MTTPTEDGEKMTNAQWEATICPIFDIAERWGIRESDAEEFLEDIGYYTPGEFIKEPRTDTDETPVTDGGQDESETLHCPYCRQSGVFDGQGAESHKKVSPPSSDGVAVEHRLCHRCTECGGKFLTVEEVEGTKETEIVTDGSGEWGYGTAVIERSQPMPIADGGIEYVTTDSGEFVCGTCGAAMDFERAGDARSPPVVETDIFACRNGHVGKKHYGPRGELIQSLNLKLADSGSGMPPDESDFIGGSHCES